MLPGVVSHLANGLTLGVAFLFEFQFLSNTIRFWDGLGDFTTLDSRQWMPSGGVISVSGLEHSREMTAPQATFTLSGATPELIALAAGSDHEYTGRPCTVYMQFLADKMTPLDHPVAIWSGQMDVMSFAAGVDNQSITLTAETLFIDRIRAPNGYMTDTDQQARWPGDRGMEFMPRMRNKTVNWLRS